MHGVCAGVRAGETQEEGWIPTCPRRLAHLFKKLVPGAGKERIWTQTEMNYGRNGSSDPEHGRRQAAGILLANHGCDLGRLETLL